MPDKQMPRIGILPLFDAEKEVPWIHPFYCEGIAAAGGIPCMLPLTEDSALWEALLDIFDGFLFPGGQDVDPSVYGQDRIPQCGYACIYRDRMELYMIRRLAELDRPVLGICRGIQLMNAAFGGTLIQDIPTAAPSSVIHLQQKPFEIPHHQIALKADSLIQKACGGYRHLSVNSMHHQAVDSPAPGFICTACAEDGLIEAIESTDLRFFLGIQWHPEFLWRSHASARGIFSAFVDAARR